MMRTDRRDRHLWTSFYRTSFLPAVLLGGALAVAACGGDGPAEPNPTPTNQADLQVTVTGPATGVPGAALAYTVRVVNGGPSAAAGVAIQATISGSVTVTAVSGGGSEASGTVTWPAISSIANGQSQDFTISLSADAPGQITVSASGSSSTPDPTPGNNDGTSAVAGTSIGRLADIVVSQTGGGGFSPGTAVALTVSVRNDGPSDADAVSVTETFVGQLTVDSISGGGALSGSTISWPVMATLAAGQTATFNVWATAPLIGPVEGRAAAMSSTTDPSQTNNNGSTPSALARLLTTFTVIRTIPGEGAGDQFGWVMEDLGDIDGDGVSDFASTAPTNDEGGSNAGKVYVYSGATGNLIRAHTGTAGEQFGNGVDLAGDIDGDGVGDMIVGAPFSSQGRAVVYSGATGAVLYSIAGPTAGEAFGSSVGRAGDVNGDGVDDFIVGAPSASVVGAGAGRAYVYSGLDGSVIFTHDPAVSGAAFGHSVGGPGDLNGDGFDDLLVGAPNTGGGGRVYVISGATGTPLYTSIAPDATAVSLGQFWLESPGDLDSDGSPDIFAVDILNSAAGSASGRAYVYSGATGATIHVLTGEKAGDQYGIGRGVADANGDGVRDIFAAGWLSSEGAFQAGKAYLHSGADGTLLRTFTSTTANENLGFDAIGIGDVDADGIPDYVLSGGISTTTPGRVLIVKGVAIP
ncbi:MAG: FG-GAP-like repeat-containing protein [Gemmatimonadota bacterium]